MVATFWRLVLQPRWGMVCGVKRHHRSCRYRRRVTASCHQPPNEVKKQLQKYPCRSPANGVPAKSAMGQQRWRTTGAMQSAPGGHRVCHGQQMTQCRHQERHVQPLAEG